MNSLPRYGSRVIREIKQGKRHPNGQVKVSAEQVRAKQTARDKKIHEAIYGKPAKAKVDARRIAKNRAWEQFSKFIRLRDADEYGIVKCCTCPARKHWKLMQAGHYVTRKKEATLFDEKCVNGQCPRCNMYEGGKPIEYEQFLERKYGIGTALALRTKAVQECKRIARDYTFIEDCYRLKVEQIKDHEPNKFKSAA